MRVEFEGKWGGFGQSEKNKLGFLNYKKNEKEKDRKKLGSLDFSGEKSLVTLREILFCFGLVWFGLFCILIKGDVN